MKVKPTFFNTRTDRLHWDYVDTNSVLFIILFDSGAEMSFIFRNLKKDGSFVSKIFMGSTFNEIVENCKKNFKEVKVYKPPSSRKDSKESFIICKKIR